METYLFNCSTLTGRLRQFCWLELCTSNELSLYAKLLIHLYFADSCVLVHHVNAHTPRNPQHKNDVSLPGTQGQQQTQCSNPASLKHTKALPP